MKRIKQNIWGILLVTLISCGSDDDPQPVIEEVSYLAEVVRFSAMADTPYAFDPEDERVQVLWNERNGVFINTSDGSDRELEIYIESDKVGTYVMSPNDVASGGIYRTTDRGFGTHQVPAEGTIVITRSDNDGIEGTFEFLGSDLLAGETQQIRNGEFELRILEKF